MSVMPNRWFHTYRFILAKRTQNQLLCLSRGSSSVEVCDRWLGTFKNEERTITSLSHQEAKDSVQQLRNTALMLLSQAQKNAIKSTICHLKF